MKNYIFNTILVHVARTWERIRLEQPHEAMPQDNIESVDSIVQIADEVIKDKVLQKFINMSETERKEWCWDTESGEGCSDVYIENIAHDIIKKDYLQ